MYKWLGIIVLIFTVALAAGCRRTGGGPAYYGGAEEENVVEGSVVVGEIVPADTDVGEEVDEFAEGGEFSAGKAKSVEAGRAEAPASVAAPYTGGVVDGYRVQVVASSYQDNANGVADQVRAAYPGTDVYVEQIQGLYKVRVGDYTDRAAAEAMRDRLRNAGYPDAWIVKEPVNQ
jgi:cell division septation protein DedD